MYDTVYRIVNATGIVRETDNRDKAIRLARKHRGRVETIRTYNAELAESRRYYLAQLRSSRVDSQK